VGTAVRVALDVDGTVIDAEAQAHPGSRERARAHADAGALVGYVTYRGEGSQAATRRMLVEAGLPEARARMPAHGRGRRRPGRVARRLGRHALGGRDGPFDREAADVHYQRAYEQKRLFVSSLVSGDGVAEASPAAGS
jgi:hypothetical protein